MNPGQQPTQPIRPYPTSPAPLNPQQWQGAPQSQYGPPQYAYAPPTPPRRPKKSKTFKILAWVAGGLAAIIVIAVIAGIASAGGSNKPAAATSTYVPTFTPSAVAPGTCITCGEPKPTDTPADTGGDLTNMKMGTTITVTDDDGGETDVTVNSATVHPAACDSFETNRGKDYVEIHVTYQQNGGSGSYNELDWHVLDTAGNQYDDIAFGCDPELGSGNNLQGRRTGNVEIEVPAGLKHGQILYTAGLLDDTQSSWKF